MSFQQSIANAARATVVCKPATNPDAMEYLQLRADGAQGWVNDPTTATPFASMRDAMRMTLRLPAGLHAFGLPLEVEVDAFRTTH